MKRTGFTGDGSLPPQTGDDAAPSRPATADELRQSVSQLQALLQMLDSSIGPASSTSGWIDPHALNPTTGAPSSEPNKATSGLPSQNLVGGADSDSDESDDAPLMLQPRPPQSSSAQGATPTAAQPVTARSPETPSPTAGLVQQLPDLLVPLQAPNGAELAQINQAYSEFAMPSIEVRYTAAMQRTQSLLVMLYAGIARLAAPLPATKGPDGTMEPSFSPLTLAVRLLQGQSPLRVMRARNDHVRKRLRLGAAAPQAERSATPSEPTPTMAPSENLSNGTAGLTRHASLPVDVCTRFGSEPRWSYTRQSVEEYLIALQEWLVTSVPSTTPPGKRERPIRLRLDRSPPPGQEGWGTWIAHFTMPPAPKVYVSFMAPAFTAGSVQGVSPPQRLEPVAVIRVTAHPALDGQPVRPRPRSVASPGPASVSGAGSGSELLDTPETADIDAAFLQPGTTRSLHTLEQRLFRVAATVVGMPAGRSEMGEAPAATWTSALRARHAVARQANPAQSNTSASLPPSTTLPLVSVQEEPDPSPWSPLGRIVLELLATGSG